MTRRDPAARSAGRWAQTREILAWLRSSCMTRAERRTIARVYVAAARLEA